MPEFDKLLARWRQLANQFCVDEALNDQVYADIESRHCEPHRHYHTLQHLADVFADLDAVLVELDPPDQAAVSFAVWFHDAIYQPGAKDNESQSACLAQSTLARLGVDDSIAARVTSMIQATRDHHNPDQHYPTQLFLDADMAILGKPEPLYKSYMANVQREYALLPAPLYRAGRKRFLEGLLEQERIFGSDCFYEDYEVAARQNIAAELGCLQ